jgi:hypothetical protein
MGGEVDGGVSKNGEIGEVFWGKISTRRVEER